MEKANNQGIWVTELCTVLQFFWRRFEIFQNGKFKKKKKTTNGDMHVAWQPSVFMITYISGSTSQTFSGTLHFCVVPNSSGIIPQATQLQKSHSSTTFHHVSLGKFRKSVLVVTLCINPSSVSRPPPALLQVTPFSTEMTSPKLQLLPFFIPLVWPPHLPVRSLMSQLGWAQLSSTEPPVVPGVQKQLLLWLLPLNTARTSFASPTSEIVLPSYNLQRSLQLSGRLQLTFKRVREKTISPRAMDRGLLCLCSRGWQIMPRGPNRACSPLYRAPKPRTVSAFTNDGKKKSKEEYFMTHENNIKFKFPGPINKV